MYKEFWNIFVNDYRRLPVAIGLFFLTIGTALLEGLNVGLLIPLLESFDSSDPETAHWITRSISSLYDSLGIPFQISTILAGLGILMLTVSGLKYLTLILVGRASISFSIWLRSRYMWNLLNADMSSFDGAQTGVQTDTLTTQIQRGGGTLRSMTLLATNGGMIIAYLTAALLIAPALTGVAIGLMVLVSITVQYNIIRSRRLAPTLVAAENDRQVSALESLNGIQVVKSFVLEKLRWADFNRRIGLAGDIDYALIKINSQMLVFQEIALFGLVGGITYVGVAIIGLDLAVVVALLFTFYRLAPRVAGINQMRQTLVVSMASLHSVNAAYEETGRTTIKTGNTPFTEIRESLEFKNVKFSYAGGVQAIKQVDFKIKKGELTAIVGVSGAGKSTLIDLMLRYYDPESGSILVDGVDLRELDLVDWRTSIGLVSQDVFLFNDTISNNISLGRDGISEANIRSAAKLAYADEFIIDLPNGYDTNVGDRGWNLSGGQRQRLALARAILTKPSILMLDEATSSLDSESERLIQKHIQNIRGTCTIIAVAHRMSTIRSADNIIVLQDGKVIEQGNSETLVDKAGVYANFQRLQAGD